MPDGDTIRTVLLGIVQGLAEFLPISSSGHLVIVDALLDRLSGASLSGTGELELNVALHLGTLGSILVVYRHDLVRVAQNPRLLSAIVIATVPAAAAGLLFEDRLRRAFETPLVAGVCLFLTAALLVIGHRADRGERVHEDISWKQALIVGLFQALALFPGISRSGSTIAGGLCMGLRRDAAAAFSFLIAVPAIGGAALLLAVKALRTAEPGGGSLPILGVGLGVSFVVGLIALKWLLRMITQRRLHWFAYYCAAVATGTIVWQLAERLPPG